MLHDSSLAGRDLKSQEGWAREDILRYQILETLPNRVKKKKKRGLLLAIVGGSC